MEAQSDMLKLERTNFVEDYPVDVTKDYFESNAIHTIIAYNLGKFFINAVKFRPVLKELLTGLAQENLSLENEIMQLNKLYKTFKGEYGGTFHDLSQNNMSRKKSQVLSFESMTVIGKVDDYTDDKHISIEKKSEVLDGFLYTLETGKKQTYDSADLTIANIIGSNMHNKIKRSKQFPLFYESWKSLTGVVKDRIKGDDSLENSIKMGYRTSATLGLIPFLENNSVPSHIIKSSGFFGSYAQILDDLADAKIDEADGVKTFAVSNSVPMDYAMKKAQEYFSSALELVDKKGKATYHMLNLFRHLDTIHNNMKIKYS